MMTRKHYRMIAEAIDDGALINCATTEALEANTQTRRQIAEVLARKLAEDNPRFNRSTFMQACGLD